MKIISIEEKQNILSLNDPSKNVGMLTEIELNLRWRNHIGRQLLTKISHQHCPAGNGPLFEEIVIEICENTLVDSFRDHVVTPHPRTLKINGVTQKFRDLSFPNNPVDTSPGCIWNVLRMDASYQLKSFVIECKNYSKKNKVTRDEIFQLFEYIDPDEHGKIGILICREGDSSLDDSARLAIIRLSKEGYKIIVIGDKELESWINAYIDGSTERFFNSLIDSRRGWPI